MLSSQMSRQCKTLVRFYWLRAMIYACLPICVTCSRSINICFPWESAWLLDLEVLHGYSLLIVRVVRLRHSHHEVLFCSTYIFLSSQHETRTTARCSLMQDDTIDMLHHEPSRSTIVEAKATRLHTASRIGSDLWHDRSPITLLLIIRYYVPMPGAGEHRILHAVFSTFYVVVDTTRTV